MREAFRFVARERRFNWGLLRTANSSSEAKRKNRPTCRSTGSSGSAAMEHYVGLDVSIKETSICVVDSAGRVLREVKGGKRARSHCFDSG